MSNIVYKCRPRKKEDNKPLIDHLKREAEIEIVLLDEEEALGKVRSEEGDGIKEGEEEKAGLEVENDKKNIEADELVGEQASTSIRREGGDVYTDKKIEKVGLYMSSTSMIYCIFILLPYTHVYRHLKGPLPSLYLQLTKPSRPPIYLQ